MLFNQAPVLGNYSTSSHPKCQIPLLASDPGGKPGMYSQSSFLWTVSRQRCGGRMVHGANMTDQLSSWDAP